MGTKDYTNTLGDSFFYIMTGIDVTARYTAKRILKSGNRMIVFWEDGTKTVVKRAEDEADNDYAAFTAALGVKLYGSNSALKRIVRSAEVQKPKKGEAVSDGRTRTD